MDENDSSSLSLFGLQIGSCLLHLALNFEAGKVWWVRPDVQRSGDIHVVQDALNRISATSRSSFYALLHLLVRFDSLGRVRRSQGCLLER